MKRIITITIALISIISLVSCKSREQKELEKAITQEVQVRGVSYFGEADKIHLRDEVINQINREEFYLSWHKSFAEAFGEASQDETQPLEKRTEWKAKSEKYKDAVTQEKKELEYLNTIASNYENIWTFTIYEMHYMYVNDNGENECDICYGKFDQNRNLVAYKMSKIPTWTVIGDDCSIPNYEPNNSLAR